MNVINDLVKSLNVKKVKTVAIPPIIYKKRCFEIAKAIKGRPKTGEEVHSFMVEYIRQLIGPELYDVFCDISTDDSCKALQIYNMVELDATKDK